MLSNQDLLLIQAARIGNIHQVITLLAEGARVNAKDGEGTSPLMFASQKGYTEIARHLLEAGADANLAREKYGITPLMFAAANHQIDVVRLLLSFGAQVN
ncbi:MAG TPA: ankyrin repeat domain-containing protein, partial [Vampirovibrionales bacterium]